MDRVNLSIPLLKMFFILTMPKQTNNLSSDLRGINKLSVDAVKGTTKVVESLHSTISQYTSILGEPKEKTNGLTGMIYKSINRVTHLLGEGINEALNKASQMHGDNTGEHKLSVTREAVAAAMNGVLGDHFEEGDNPLAISMSFRVKGQSLNKNQLFELFQNATNKFTILIHGLCMNDLQWTRDGHNHGELLAEELNHTIIYLHYNTGLHISENGRQLSQLLNEIEQLDGRSINILAHSMGGLVARSACYYAALDNHEWLSHLGKIIFLGTPHHGAVLAKGGHWVDILLQISPYSAPFAKVTKTRSSGLTDLRYGSIIDEDWSNEEARKIVPLPQNIQCYSIATSISANESSKVANDVVGDGLVTINSALGKHKDKNLNLDFAEDHLWIGGNIGHMQLLSDSKVYEVIKNWMS